MKKYIFELWCEEWNIPFSSRTLEPERCTRVGAYLTLERAINVMDALTGVRCNANMIGEAIREGDVGRSVDVPFTYRHEEYCKNYFVEKVELA